MLFCDIDYLDADFEVAHGYVGVEDGRITYVGEGDPANNTGLSAGGAPAGITARDYGERYSGAGKLLIPGLYNAHTHAPMTLLRGYGENLSLQDWLNTRIFPFEAKITDEAAYPATQLAIAEMLRFGTVSFSDMYYFSDARAQAIASSGIKANISHGVIVFDDTNYSDLPNKAVAEHLVDAYHNTHNGRLKVDFCIHTEFTTTPKVVEAVGQAAVDFGVGTQIHLSETQREHEECKQRRDGKTPAQYFESLGFFRQPCSAAHCVWSEPGDWELFKRNNVTAVCNPASNMKLASGYAPIPQMLEAGVRVALGTDGVASNNSHNLLKDLYLFALIYKGSSGDPTVVTPADALRAATLAGAQSQGRGADCGTIAPGNHADLVVLDTAVPWMQPMTSPLSNLVYSAQGSDVVLTMVDGTVLYRDGIWPTIDVERAIHETAQHTRAIIASL
ncbi:MAG: amidohydrolase [Coriobacteriales bacterium]|jgi:5-methylthioadenosine/S-adenosylhomocysteine deaminase|nr:amidohydrolase [Coriobacteriales bacterium]